MPLLYLTNHHTQRQSIQIHARLFNNVIKVLPQLLLTWLLPRACFRPIGLPLLRASCACARRA